MKNFFLFGIFLFLCHGQSFAEETKDRGALYPYVVVAGTGSQITERGYFRITSQQEFQEIWKKHKGISSPYSRMDHQWEDFPQVDFEKCMVIAIFNGAGLNSMGVYANSVLERNDYILFRFGSPSYQTGEEGMKVSPFGFFVLPRSNMPMVLEEEHYNLIGSHPTWEERFRFEKLKEDVPLQNSSKN